jgi:hypothetical protein
MEETLAVPFLSDSYNGLFTQLTLLHNKNSIDAEIAQFNVPVWCDPFMIKSAIFGKSNKQSYYNYAAAFPISVNSDFI